MCLVSGLISAVGAGRKVGGRFEMSLHTHRMLSGAVSKRLGLLVSGKKTGP